MQIIIECRLNKAGRTIIKKINRYLSGRGDTMITKVVYPGEAYPLHSGCADSLRFTQMWENSTV